MNSNQISRKNMIEATLNYLDENANEWQSVAKMVSTKTQLSQINEAIDQSAKEQADAVATLGKTKILFKKAIATKADILNDIVEVYASIEGDDELARQMGDSKSDLYVLPYNELILKAQTIINTATELKETLIAEYGMTEEQITDLQNDVNRLLELNGQPRAYQIKSVIATKELEDLFSQSNDLLANKLDKLMSIFKTRNANFYNGYVRARMIIE